MFPIPMWLAGTAGRAVAIAVAVCAVFGYGYFKGSAHVQNKFDAYRAEVSAAGLAQTQQTERINKTQKQVTAKSEAEYEANRNAIRALYMRMRQQSRIGALSSVPGPADKPDDEAANDVSLAPILAERCAETTQQLISLQNWILDEIQVTNVR